MVGDAAAEDLAEPGQRLLQAVLGERALDHRPDLAPLQRGGLGGQLALAPGEVVVDRAAAPSESPPQPARAKAARTDTTKQTGSPIAVYVRFSSICPALRMRAQ